MPSTASSAGSKAKKPQRPISRPVNSSASRIKFSSKKSGELFSRLNVNSFVTLVLQSAQIALEEQLVLQAIEDAKREGDIIVDPIEITEDQIDRSVQKNGIGTTDHSTLQSVIVGVGELDFVNETSRQEARKVLGMPKSVDTNSPYLLLDVRTDDEFKKCHIITALNYPASMLARMFNYETRELVAYKNVAGKLIIFYDDLERESPRVASTLYERGYDNVYVLTGGLTSIYRSYPNGLITGTLPVQVLRSSPEPARRTANSSKWPSSSMARSASSPSVAKFTGSKPRSENGSKWNPFDERGELKEKFGDDDLYVLRQKLGNNLLPRMKRGTLAKSTLASKAQTSRESSEKQKEKHKHAQVKPWIYNGPV